MTAKDKKERIDIPIEPQKVPPSMMIIQQIQKQATVAAIANENLINSINALITYTQGLEAHLEKLEKEKQRPEQKEG